MSLQGPLPECPRAQPFYHGRVMPVVDEVVAATVVAARQNYLVVELREFCRSEGIVPFTELARTRVRSMSTLFAVDQLLALKVLRVDAEHRTVDLSRKQVVPQEGHACLGRYESTRTVMAALEQVPPECHEAAVALLWDLQRRLGDERAAATLLSGGVSREEALSCSVGNAAVAEAVLAACRAAGAARGVTATAEVELSCAAADGVDAIRRAAASASAAAMPLAACVTIVAPPAYAVCVAAPAEGEAVAAVERVLAALQTAMIAACGTFAVLSPARVVNANRDGAEW